MSYRVIPPAAIAAGKAASPYLMRNFRDNDLSIDNHARAVLAQLNTTTGHPHGVETRTFTYLFEDRIETKASVNDRFDITFGGGDGLAATLVATLDAGIRTLAAHASHVTARVKSAILGTIPAYVSTGNVPFLCTYDTTEGSESRGFFRLQHTGALDTPHPRVFRLLGKTGTNRARSALTPIGFSKVDWKGAYGYTAENGFADGYIQEQFAEGNGGLLESDAWVAGAFTNPKYAAKIIANAAFADGAVTAAKTANHALTGPKFGAPTLGTVGGVNYSTIGSLSSVTFRVDLPNGGSGRTCMCRPICINDPGNPAENDLLYVTSNGWSTDHYNVVVKNATLVSMVVRLPCY